MYELPLLSSYHYLKSIRVHLSPGSSCGLVAYTLRILTQRYTLFSYLLLVGIKA